MNTTAVGVVAGAIGITGSVCGMASICSSCCKGNALERSYAFKSGLYKLAIGVAGIGIAQGIYWATTSNYEVGVALDFYTSKLVTSTDASPVCNLETLRNILGRNSQPLNSALFNSFDCNNFLPWNATFEETLKDSCKVITGITPADMNQSIMWTISPSQAPAIIFGESQGTVSWPSLWNSNFKREIFTLLVEKDYLSMTCRLFENAVTTEEGHTRFVKDAIHFRGGMDGKLLEGDFIDTLFAVNECFTSKELLLSLVKKTTQKLLP